MATWSSGIDVNNAMQTFVAALEREVPSVPVHVTSGIRSPERQARALVYKRNNEGDSAVRRLYGQKDLIGEVLAAANTTAAMARVLTRQVRSGRFLSRHMRGDAVDLRTRNLTKDQVQKLKAGAKRLGGHAVIEVDHLHVGRVGGGVTAALATSARTSLFAPVAYAVRRVPWWGWGLSSASVLVLFLAVQRRRARRRRYR
jgi:hypothetical protein